MAHVFGPVPSRRLGRSLGVDVVPFKVCSYDCIYCQLGRTTRHIAQREEWVPLEEVLADVRSHLGSNPDYITLSGSGEPTLYARLGELIAGIRELTDTPVAVLTNGSLLWDPAVRADVASADLIVPSLDAGSPEMFRKVNRPHVDITFERMLEGLVACRSECSGLFWLEVFLLAGLNDSEAELDRLVACVERIQPDRIQLNTVARPPAEDYATAISPKRMAEIAQRFGPRAEVIADFRGVHEQAEFVGGREEVLSLLERRPCSIEDIAEGLAMHRNEVVKYIEELAAQGLVVDQRVGDKLYYHAGRDSRE